MTTATGQDRRLPAPAALPASRHWLEVADEAVRVHGAVQKAEEFAQLLEIAAEVRPETIIEVGADKGGTLYGWSQLPGPPKVLAVDMPWGPYRLARQDLPELHGAELVIGDSHSRATLRSVMDWLDGRKADVVFIDADHRYGAVKADFRNFRQLARDGGLIAFHDIIIHPKFATGVNQFWLEELVGRWPTTEIITEPRDWGGIGVLTNRPLPPPEPVRITRSVTS